MPTYDYECPDGHRFELFQRMSDDPVAACPECGQNARRQISGGAGFLFKGDGFYITDYRSEDYKKKASAEAPDQKSDSGTKTDSAKSGDSSSASGGGSSSSSESGSPAGPSSSSSSSDV